MLRDYVTLVPFLNSQSDQITHSALLGANTSHKMLKHYLGGRKQLESLESDASRQAATRLRVREGEGEGEGVVVEKRNWRGKLLVHYKVHLTVFTMWFFPFSLALFNILLLTGQIPKTYYALWLIVCHFYSWGLVQVRYSTRSKCMRKGYLRVRWRKHKAQIVAIYIFTMFVQFVHTISYMMAVFVEAEVKASNFGSMFWLFLKIRMILDWYSENTLEH